MVSPEASSSCTWAPTRSAHPCSEEVATLVAHNASFNSGFSASLSLGSAAARRLEEHRFQSIRCFWRSSISNRRSEFWTVPMRTTNGTQAPPEAQTCGAHPSPSYLELLGEEQGARIPAPPHNSTRRYGFVGRAPALRRSASRGRLATWVPRSEPMRAARTRPGIHLSA